MERDKKVCTAHNQVAVSGGVGGHTADRNAAGDGEDEDDEGRRQRADWTISDGDGSLSTLTAVSTTLPATHGYYFISGGVSTARTVPLVHYFLRP